MADERKEVVILGGGFAGLQAARALARAQVRVTLLDRRNHHLFQPLLYQVATASLNPSDIAAPLRRILRHQKNARVLLGEASSVELTRRLVHLGDGGALPYDYLIVATGASHNYFGHDEYAPLAPGLKTIEDAVEIRRRVLTAYEEAERTGDPELRRRLLTFVIVGGGPTGAELAGAFGEISRQTLPGEYSSFDPREARILLIEAGPRVLMAYPPELSTKAARQLARLGVEVRAGTSVTRIDERGVSLKSASGVERVETANVVWAAGVEASPLVRTLAPKVDRAGRVLVEPDLSLPGAPEVYVVGDAAHLEEDGHQVPGLAPAAMQMGKHAAKNILAQLEGRPTAPFHYRDKGSMATIGRGAGIAVLGRLSLSGFLGWLAWLLVHIVFLIGFRNRAVVLFDWAWAFFTRQRNARLITDTAEQARFELSRSASPPSPDGHARAPTPPPA
jgi:NADH dehydrogenase